MSVSSRQLLEGAVEPKGFGNRPIKTGRLLSKGEDGTDSRGRRMGGRGRVGGG